MPTSKTALVTGSARGIGNAIARRLAEDGVRVIGIDAIPASEAPFIDQSIELDLADVKACASALVGIGDVDILVNNAALLLEADFEQGDIEALDRMYAVNLRAPLALSRALVPRMAERNWGRVVNISSLGVHTGGLSPQSALYASSKAGLHTVTRYIARVYGPHGVTANVIAPAWVNTEMGARSLQTGVGSAAATIPLRRMSTPAEIASVAAFLASDQASYITGAVLDVNGGWLMR